MNRYISRLCLYDIFNRQSKILSSFFIIFHNSLSLRRALVSTLFRNVFIMCFVKQCCQAPKVILYFSQLRTIWPFVRFLGVPVLSADGLLPLKANIIARKSIDRSSSWASFSLFLFHFFPHRLHLRLHLLSCTWPVCFLQYYCSFWILYS